LPDSTWNVRVIAAGAEPALAGEMRLAGCSEAGIERMAPKAEGMALALEQVDAAAANLLKQEMLAVGGDAALAHETWAGGPAATGLVLVGTRLQFETLLVGLGGAPRGVPEIGRAIAEALEHHSRRRFELDLAGRVLVVGPAPALMGIVNVTPDSFSDGGECFDTAPAVARAVEQAGAGADILDIGGESTRPGSESVGEDEELRRVIPVIEKLAGRVDVPISIDTRRGRVAREAIAAGARIINDVSGLQGESEVAAAAADTGAAVVIMHMLGQPRTMQVSPRYDNVMADICRYLRAGMDLARQAGIRENRIIVDPGIGFGKRLEHNLEVLARLGQMRSLGRPILVGPSRKQFIGELTGVETPAARTFGTAAACAMAVAAGALILRVHDVGPMREAVKVAAAIAAERN